MDFAAFTLCLEVSDAQQDKAWNQFFSLHFIPQVKVSTGLESLIIIYLFASLSLLMSNIYLVLP